MRGNIHGPPGLTEQLACAELSAICLAFEVKLADEGPGFSERSEGPAGSRDRAGTQPIAGIEMHPWVPKNYRNYGGTVR